MVAERKDQYGFKADGVISTSGGGFRDDAVTNEEGMMSEVTASAGAERAAGGAELSADQAQSLYRDGFVVLKDLIPKETWSAARRQLMMRLGAVQQAASGYSPARRRTWSAAGRRRRWRRRRPRAASPR